MHAPGTAEPTDCRVDSDQPSRVGSETYVGVAEPARHVRVVLDGLKTASCIPSDTTQSNAAGNRFFFFFPAAQEEYTMSVVSKSPHHTATHQLHGHQKKKKINPTRAHHIACRFPDSRARGTMTQLQPAEPTLPFPYFPSGTARGSCNVPCHPMPCIHSFIHHPGHARMHAAELNGGSEFRSGGAGRVGKKEEGPGASLLGLGRVGNVRQLHRELRPACCLPECRRGGVGELGSG